jgi:heat-inducible transcriptional repressor
MRLSSASIRSTLGELAVLGLVEQPHTSAGRIPTEEGLRLFIDQLLDPAEVAEYDRRTIAYGVDAAEADSLPRVTSHLLSECTRLLGFMVAPRLDRVVLQHVSLVRLSSERLLAVLVSKEGTAYRRIIEDDTRADQAELDHMAALLNERVAGRSLRVVRRMLRREAHSLRREAGRLLARALELGSRALPAADEVEVDLVIATRLALFEQPEFHDPQRVRDLLEAVEAKERLLEVLDHVLGGEGVTVALGGEVDDPGLHRCALVVTPYGTDKAPMGVLGVIGPSRMDYGRVIPLVDYFSRVVTEKLSA